MISGYDCWNRKGLSRRRKLESVGAKTTSSGSPFQNRGPETLKVRLPTVDSRNIGTTRRLELAERSARRPWRSATRSSGPRYVGNVVVFAVVFILRDKITNQGKNMTSLMEVKTAINKHHKWYWSDVGSFDLLLITAKIHFTTMQH